MIEIKHLTKKYGDKAVVNDNSWIAGNGKITGFIGPNGAGKTTTLSMITGSLNPTAGSIALNGIDIMKDPIKAKQCFGYVSDSPDHFLRLKGIEYLTFMADIYGTPTENRTAFIRDYGERFGIYDALDQPILSYSHGMRQKVMVMGALIHNPSIWILDEPLTGLDPQSAYELKEMMREHTRKGNSVLFSTHVLEVAEKLCDEIIVINHGVICYNGTLDVLKERYPNQTLEEIFIQMMQKEAH